MMMAVVMMILMMAVVIILKVMMEFGASGLRLFSVNRIGQTLSAHSHMMHKLEPS